MECTTLCRINRFPGRFPLEEPQEVRGYAGLGPLEQSQEQARFPIDLFCYQMLLLASELNRLLNRCARDLQERRRCLDEFVVMHRT